ncbi:HWE histidine kinase domain-containing protein [Sphingomonas sp. LB3N6]|uniref:HWE histidine kinase domain-containing protein n=1 Tax=Sphingomonas fucosidasi TaxID=3096164 RepID=UPI002FCBB1C3
MTETLRKQSREHQGETLRHVRNALGVVRTIACRPVAVDETAEEYQARLVGRLDSFARLQSYLFRDPAAGVDLYSLIADELVAFCVQLGTEAQVDGQAVFVKPKAASALAGVFHELTRISIEGGALTYGDSRITVSWSVEGQGDAAPDLWINWTERGRQTGLSSDAEDEFSRELEGPIAYALAGTVALDITGDTLSCRFRIPASWIVCPADAP